MQKGLVSIITPCYNTGSIVHRLLDSILEQDYPSVEMFAIDDGSTDNTPDVIKSYIPKFKQKGYRLSYVRQENGGQSSAINNGLKMVSGEYLIWPDSDDYFRCYYALSRFVDTFINHDESYGVVRCVPMFVNEKSLKSVDRIILSKEYYDENQFENCLFSQKFFWGAGNYMIKISAFEKANHQRDIYVEKNAGQNWQMLLPVVYSFKCVTLNDRLFNILERVSSHSRGQYKTYDQLVAKFDSYRNTIINTLDRIQTMPQNKRDEYKRIIRNKYKINQLELAITCRKKVEISKLKAELQQEGIIIDRKRELIIKLRRYKVISLLIRVISKLKI